LPFPLVIDPEDLPLRSQRHMSELNRNAAYPPCADFGARAAAMFGLRTDASEGRRAK
jgi:hypothetical protein